MSTGAARIRREPPRFRPVAVRSVQPLSRRMVSVTFEGADLEGLVVEQPAASVRLLLPSPATDELVMPSWNGNEFLLPDGRRPTIRTLTPPRVVETDALELELAIVLHGAGAASEWAAAAEPGRPAAIAGPGRGYSIDSDAQAFVIAGDETAIPAISQLLEAIPATTPVTVLVEVGHPDGRQALPEHPRGSVTWLELGNEAPPGDALVAAVRDGGIAEGTRVWVAGEAAAVQRIRRHLFEERHIPRAQATVRGYWKHGRAADSADET